MQLPRFFFLLNQHPKLKLKQDLKSSLRIVLHFFPLHCSIFCGFLDFFFAALILYWLSFQTFDSVLSWYCVAATASPVLNSVRQAKVAHWSADMKGQCQSTCLFSLVLDTQGFMSSLHLLDCGGRLGCVIMRSAARIGLYVQCGQTLQREPDGELIQLFLDC